ncbi:MAG: hypothetical protein L0271_17845, partial [Gemmatimonadetes bacterium]|nr:hypothetical protein [Gemmatimonadota bacterium]
VLFDGLRGRVLTATATRLDVEVPQCALTRDVRVTVALGAVMTASLPMRTLAGTVPILALAPGQARTFTDASDLACIALDGVVANAEYMIVAQNRAERVGFPARVELNAIVDGGAPAVVVDVARAPTLDAASTWELRLRQHEASFGPAAGDAIPAAASPAAAAAPKLGDRRTFNVLKPDLTSRKATAEVKALSSHAVLYVDVQAPANGLTEGDLALFGAMFDDPIHETVTRVFGSPSDLDANQRIVILFTPAVNQLTEPGASGLIAGYFYGCDLVPETRCSATNGGEILYSMVPDPSGQFSGVRSRNTVLRTVPGVLAHEFQHMIHFGRRNGSLDVLWIAEGLAHAAEDIVGDVFLARGDALTADDFRRPNHVRTQYYLGEPAMTPLIAEEAPGSLEMRGAAWLFMKYLMGHYGGNDLLGRVTGLLDRGVPNIVGATGRPWDELLSEFGMAVWADDAPELASTAIGTRFRFTNLNVRSVLAGIPGGYPLRPHMPGFGDFQWSGLIASAGQDYIQMRAPPANPPRIHLALTGLRGALPGTPVQLTILRIR